MADFASAHTDLAALRTNIEGKLATVNTRIDTDMTRKTKLELQLAKIKQADAHLSEVDSALQGGVA